MKPRWIVAGLIGLAVILLISVAIHRTDSQPAPEPHVPVSTESIPAQEPESAPEAAFAPQAPQPEPLPVELPTPSQARPAPSEKPQQAKKRVALRITGTVEDAQGQPLENVQLRWIPLDFGQEWKISRDGVLADGDASRLPPGPLRDAMARSRTTRSDPEGGFVFEFDRLKPPIGVVAATARGYEIAIRRVEARHDGDSPPEQVLELEVVMNFQLGFAGIISGTVRDRISGAAAQGMAVAAQSHEPGTSPMMMGISGTLSAALSDDEGRYSIQGLSPGEYWVAPKTGYSDYVTVSFQKGKKVTLEAGSEITNLDFEVDRGGRISGRFLDPDREPVQGVSCSALPSDLTAKLMSGNMGMLELFRGRDEKKTPADGSFDFRGLPLENSYRVQGTVEGLAAVSSDPVHLTEDAPQAELEIVMPRGSMIFGSVVQQDGRPAAKTRVSASLESQNPLELLTSSAFHYAQADEQGNFELKNLNAGKYRLMAGETINFLALMGSRGQDEEAESFVTVEVDGQTDASGIVLILDEPDQSLISGIVENDLGQPIENATVGATNISTSQTFSAAAVSGPDGAFELQTQGEGPFRVEAQSKFSRVILPKVEAGILDLRIVLSRPGFVSGRVVTPDGIALPSGTRVEARPFEAGDPQSIARRMLGQASSFATPAAEGIFRIEAPAGQVEIVARASGFAPAHSSPVTVQPGEETANVEILLTQGAVLLGTVVHTDGSPLEGAEVRALLDEDSLISQLSRSSPVGWMLATNVTTTDSQGRFEFSNLRPGSYSVSARYSSHAPSETLQIDLDEGRTQQVRLEIAWGGTISGFIVRGDIPQPGLAVLASSAGAPLRTAASDERGHFLIEGLSSGEYGLQVMEMFGSSQRILKSVQIAVLEEEAQHVEIDLASGQRIFGSIRGGSAEANYQILVRRPGGTPPQALSPVDFAQISMLSVGSAQIQTPSDYEIVSVDPGRYLLEVYRLPDDLSDIGAYQALDRSPLFQQEVMVGERDVRVDIVLR